MFPLENVILEVRSRGPGRCRGGDGICPSGSVAIARSRGSVEVAETGKGGSGLKHEG